MLYDSHMQKIVTANYTADDFQYSIMEMPPFVDLITTPFDNSEHEFACGVDSTTTPFDNSEHEFTCGVDSTTTPFDNGGLELSTFTQDSQIV
jgi:hypothetical protein